MSKTTTASMTFISDGAKITGDLEVEHDLRIEGQVKGTIRVAGTLVLGPTGRIEGDVTVRSATLAGQLTGNIKASEKIVMETKSSLIGDLETRELVINEGAIFQGKSMMRAEARNPLQ
jgi:cytoskeletal protein CcmA (bactofilin family)